MPALFGISLSFHAENNLNRFAIWKDSMERLAKINVAIGGMSCAACVRRVERALSEVEGVLSASVNLATGRATLEVTKSFQEEAARQAIEENGYQWLGVVKDDEIRSTLEEFQQREKRKLLMKLTGGGILTMVIHAVAVSSIDPRTVSLIQFLLAAPVVFWVGSPFIVGALNALKKGTSDMNTLVSLGSLAAFGYSASVTFFPSIFSHSFLKHGVYYDGASMIVTLVLLGRFLEARTRERASRAIRKLLQLKPNVATLVLPDGETKEVAAEQISVGDRFLIRAGERCPVDGVVIEGSSSMDESMLTGESIPKPKKTGDSVYAGTVNIEGMLICRASAPVGRTFLDQIVRLVEEAQGRKASIQRLADRVSSVFVPVVIALSLVTLFVWWHFSSDISRALMMFASVLVISCPCALGLATPTAIMVGTGIGAEEGILFRGGDVLELMGKVATVVFDKTGTLTKGRPVVTDIVTERGISEEELMGWAASVEKGSLHPLALAIVEKAEEGELKFSMAKDVVTSPGYGSSGVVDGSRVLVGSGIFIEAEGISTKDWEESVRGLASSGKTVIFVARDGKVVGLIGCSDHPKDDALRTVSELKTMGIRVVMLTGDRFESARFIAGRIGIDEVIAGVLPDEKARVIEDLRRRTGKAVAMVGDGINDAPALVTADVGIAIGAGTDIAVESGDVTLMGDRLSGVVEAFVLSRYSLRIIKQNLFWAFFYNILGIPLAGGAFYPLFHISLTPTWAAAAMAMSSVSVVGNALRLRRIWIKWKKNRFNV